MDTKFKIGDVVRIGGVIPSTDHNYHKRGIVKRYFTETRPMVQLIDTWSDPDTKFVDWLAIDCWELYETSSPNFELLL